jgi:predicted PurR-regulated permease PerM/uncharacterized protein YrrD
MKQSRKINHLPVYDRETGLKAGYMMGFQYGGADRTEGLFFNDAEGRWRMIAWDQVEILGEDAVFLKPGAQALILDKSPARAALTPRPAAPIYSAEGLSPGRASDILLQGHEIVGLEVSDGLVKDILRGRSLLMNKDIEKWGPDMILVKPSAILYQPQYSLGGRLGRILLLLGLFLLFLWPLKALLRPVLTGLLVAYGLYPAAAWFQKRGRKPGQAALLALLLFIVLLTLGLALLIPLTQKEWGRLLGALPELFERLGRLIQQVPLLVSRFGIEISWQSWQAVLDQAQAVGAARLSALLPDFDSGLSRLADFLLAPVLAFYFLKEWERIKGWILRLFSVSFQGDLVFVGGEIRQIVAAFIKGNLLTSLVVGVLTYIGLELLGLKYTGVMAALAGLGNLIPYFGAFFSSVPVILLGLLQAPWKAAAALVIVTLIQQLEGDFLTPRILGASLELPPLAIVLSLLLAGKFFGLFGMFLAAPMAAVLKVIARRVIARLV